MIRAITATTNAIVGSSNPRSPASPIEHDSEGVPRLGSDEFSRALLQVRSGRGIGPGRQFAVEATAAQMHAKAESGQRSHIR